MTDTVKQLLIINIIFYVGSNINGDVAYQLFSQYYPENANFRIWQPLTYMFMHSPVYNGTGSEISHILMNMFGLIMFGPILEHYWGAKKFIFFYISCGLGAVLTYSGIEYYQLHSLLSGLKLSPSEIHTLLNADYTSIFDEKGRMVAGSVRTILENINCTQEQFDKIIEAVVISKGTMVGASGAITGLLVAFAFTFPNAPMGLLFIPIEIKAKYFVSAIIAIDFISGLNGGSLFGSPKTHVAYFAHIGGALTGFIMMWYWKQNQFNKNRWN
jgi:membrane associated rhomboid family serine protease